MGPVVGWLIMIWIVNSLPRQTFPQSIRKSPHADPQAPVLLYRRLSVRLGRGLSGPRRNGAGVARMIGLTVGLSAALAARDEWHKMLIPARRGQVGDWLCDQPGSRAGACGWTAVVAFIAPQTRPQPAVRPDEDGG